MKTQKQQGFTIIEVVLVLAIAGLIFLVVFMAVPALQRSQRDTARRNDVGRVSSAVQSWRTNNQGKLPDTAAKWTTLTSTYLNRPGDVFEDPSHGAYSLSTTTGPTAVPGDGVISVHTGYVCGDGGVATNAAGTGAGARTVAIRINLESGGVYCTAN